MTGAGVRHAAEAPPAWHALPAERVRAALDAPGTGLTDEEAARRLARDGPNRLAVAAPTSAWRILAGQFASVVVGLLVVAAVLALAVGEPLDSAAIVVVLALNVLIGFVTELRARRSLDALRALDVSHATVVRGGRARDVDAATLVVGDVVVLEPGMAVPADARLLAASELRVVESALTGEARTVGKHADATVAAGAPLAERATMVYKATLVVAGSAQAIVVATGGATEVGRIGTLVAGIEADRTPMERRLDVLGRRLAVVSVAVAVLVAALNLAQGIPLARVLETAIALAIAAIPEGLPAVVTITMAVGVRRMARRRALIRRLPTVESLGAATVVCTDKTGTLTLGEMTTTTIWLPADDGAGEGREVAIGGVGHVPEGTFAIDGAAVSARDVPGLADALVAGALANRADLYADGAQGWSVRGDPTEVALLVAARKAGIERGALVATLPEIAELPFSSERMTMATFHRAPGGETRAYAKGAPARLLDVCTCVRTPIGDRALDAPVRDAVLAANQALAARGLRVLAVAEGPAELSALDRSLGGLTLLGLVGLTDPPAPGVVETIGRLRGAGIRTLMLTGDQRLTALAIARTLGMTDGAADPARADDLVLDGPAIDALDDAALTERVARVSTYSRVSPAAKLRIVDALRRRGEIVAMLGDGVNDAPALRRADVGVAMGRRGTDIAKDAAGVVLADDRFPTIAAAVEEGRVVYDNLRRFVFFLFSCNLAEILLLLAAGVAGLPAPLLPLQLLWLNLLTDTLPALALAFEPPEAAVMRRPPRRPDAPLLSRALVVASIGHSIGIAGAALVPLLVVDDVARAETMTFMTLALAQVVHVANARRLAGRTRPAANRYATAAVVVTTALQLLPTAVPTLARVLGVVPLGAGQWALVAALSLVPLAVGVVARAARPGSPDAEPTRPARS